MRSLLAVALALRAVTAALGAEPPEPHFDATKRRVEYHGPGREEAPPDGLREVRIGYFGPSDPSHADGGDLWLAVRLAVAEANAAGGHGGLPYRLVPAWSANPWGTGVARLAGTVYSDGVWAIVGSIDGASTHLAEQVVAKARLTLVAPAGTDASVNLANVAWAFSCLPADDSLASAVAGALKEEARGRPFTLISSTDHDSHHTVVEIAEALGGLGIAPARHLEIEPGEGDLSAVVAEVETTRSTAAVVVASPADSARVVTLLRERAPAVRIFGGPAMGRRTFLEQAGEAAEGVVFPLLCDPSFASSEFADTFASRFGRPPDCVAAQAYDATRLLIAAIEDAGLNRARIRDSVEALSPWSGVAGAVRWSPLGRNAREVRLAEIREGRIVPLSASTASHAATD